MRYVDMEDIERRMRMAERSLEETNRTMERLVERLKRLEGVASFPIGTKPLRASHNED